MVEHSPYATLRACGCVDFQLRIPIDDCAVAIAVTTTPHGLVGRWQCGQCGQNETVDSKSRSCPEFVVNAVKGKAIEHVMRLHPGPKTLAFFESF